MNRFLATPGGAGLAAAVCWLLPQFVPLFAPLRLLMPLPLLLVALRSGVWAGFAASVVPVFTDALATGAPLVSIGVFLFLAWVPLLLTWLLLCGWKVSQSLFVGYLIAVILLVLGMGVAGMKGVDIGPSMESLLDGVIAPIRDASVASMAKRGHADPRAVAIIQEETRHLVTFMARILPAVMIGGWFFIVCGNLLLARRLVAAESGGGLFVPEDLTAFRAPFFLVWPLIVAVVLAQFTGGNWQYFGLNLGLLLAIPSLFQGMAVIQWGMRTFKVPVWVQRIYQVFLLIWLQFLFVVALIGLLDHWFDFRGRYIDH
ncbi:MAG: DUF2232 domain-containing protein [Magnetococcales bacterium]|nr:DUF2232 domain-containing protein [Magnetococcales bacterium]